MENLGHNNTYHTIMPEFPEGLGRGVHPQFASMFRFHVIGGEPIAINRA